jgi:hypothetical protein
MAALSDLRNARTAFETYYADKKNYPETLEATGFKSSVGVEVKYSRTAPDKYRLTTSHRSGDREYMCSSDGPAVYQRKKKEPSEEWQPV